MSFGSLRRTEEHARGAVGQLAPCLDLVQERRANALRARLLIGYHVFVDGKCPSAKHDVLTQREQS